VSTKDANVGGERETEKERDCVGANQGREVRDQEHLRGKYHCTVDLLFDLFGLVCFANKNKSCQL
jgi:hypothetical protein